MKKLYKKVLIAFFIVYFIFLQFFIVPKKAEAFVISIPLINITALALASIGLFFATSHEARNASLAMLETLDTTTLNLLNDASIVGRVSSSLMNTLHNRVIEWNNTWNLGQNVITNPLPVQSLIIQSSAISMRLAPVLNQYYHIIVTAQNLMLEPQSVIIVLNNHWLESIANTTMQPNQSVTFLATFRAIEHLGATFLQFKRPDGTYLLSPVSGTNFEFRRSGTGTFNWGVSNIFTNTIPQSRIITSAVATPIITDLVHREWHTADGTPKRMVGWPLTWPSISSEAGLNTIVGKTTAQLTQSGVIQQSSTFLNQDILTGILAIPTSIARFFDLTIPIDLAPLQIAGTTFTTRFPFSIPWDIARAFAISNAAGTQSPRFDININTGLLGRIQFSIDFTAFQHLIAIQRDFLILLFIIGLAILTPKITKV